MSDVERSLYNWEGSELPAEKCQLAFEQYRLYLDLTDRLSQRRQTASTFFVTMNTAVVGVLGYAKTPKTYVFISIAGLILCLLWWRMIQSYRELNRARLDVIYAMETLMPLRPYTAEWDLLGRGNPKLYKPIGGVEAYVPLLFFVLYACVLGWSLAAS